MLINNTPVRTCKKFNINNFGLNVEIPNKISKFENVSIFKETGKDKILTDFDISNINLKYGTGTVNQIQNQFNQKFKIFVNSITNKEIRIEYDFDENNLNLVDYIEIIGEENTISNIYIVYKNKLCKENCNDINKRCSGVNCAPYHAFHNGLIKVLAKQNSKISVNIINLMSKESSNILSIDSKLEKNSNVNWNIVDFGGKESITNLYSNLEGKESISSVNTIYLGTDNDRIDINYIAECFGEKTKVNMDIQGALKDESIKHFKGTIDFKKGCKNAIGNESENCMLLSDKVKSLALPMLLCSEEDVEGNHSASSGKADNKELFYLMTRGFSKKEAEKLLIRAKFNSLLNKISNKEIKNEISYEIDQKLN